ncbi:MAG: cyclic pyranopterin monophosphate synthase MoaC [Saprospiraceae bacterium]|nr:cyclic pyranopterin monophosphate synthase MoaC [Saprospiraceae bacterium]
MENKEFSHIDKSGRANMVDVGGKPDSERKAVAEGYILLQSDTVRMIRENIIKKGDVLSIAEFAGITAAKKTSELIPLCHQLNLSKVEVFAETTDKGVKVTATTKCIGQTGVEMEALTSVSIALLTIYDMCKAVDKEMVISGIKLVCKEKTEKIKG